MTLPYSTRLTVPVDDLADAILELFVLTVALGFAHLLHDHLLGGLGGDAAEIHGRQRIGDEIADFASGLRSRASSIGIWVE